jgi:hypothetical protein
VFLLFLAIIKTIEVNKKWQPESLLRFHQFEIDSYQKKANWRFEMEACPTQEIFG